ncbi:class I SAM-dependent methyltransferase [Roseateles koreensis]|uniref:Class I SAM-dependent methyltransferase n=1 Tax=Roseateles koreensis TaxID=2987526 RepID=A0ABT5KNN2_9BURK|nr:class I SAM-dependent methyltransferase [Roseateles koreensis]MDC8784530.1 class I SAM-dependent methyltransferase [Roseateles koreensis]
MSDHSHQAGAKTDAFDSNAYQSVRRRLAAVEAEGGDTYECMGRNFVVHEGVFPPTHFQSTGIFTRHLPYVRGGSFLEIGCGAGVTAVTAALEGCVRVVASDISEVAVLNTRANAILHGVGAIVSTRHGDLFDVLREGERFDVIFWNSNFVFVPDEYVFDKEILRAFCDAGYAAHRRFLKDAQRYLNTGGMLLLGFSSQGDESALTGLLGTCGYKSTVLKSVFGQGPGAPRYDILQLFADHQPATVGARQGHFREGSA